MKFKLKYLTIFITIASFAAIFYGLWSQSEAMEYSEQWIGGGTVGLFLVAMPLFLFQESRGKQIKDYMLTKENIEKMNSNEKHTS